MDYEVLAPKIILSNHRMTASQQLQPLFAGVKTLIFETFLYSASSIWILIQIAMATSIEMENVGREVKPVKGK